MKILSWNVNGIRAVEKKGFIDYVRNSNYDIIGIQETKAQPDQLSEELLNIEGYKSYFKWAEKKGYSGVAIYSKEEPIEVSDMGVSDFDNEGRVIFQIVKMLGRELIIKLLSVRLCSIFVMKELQKEKT